MKTIIRLNVNELQDLSDMIDESNLFFSLERIEVKDNKLSLYLDLSKELNRPIICEMKKGCLIEIVVQRMCEALGEAYLMCGEDI